MGIIKNYQAKGSCKVTFTYPVNAAENAKTVQVLGDFNNWDSKKAPKMKKGKEEFSTVVEIKAGNRYEFRYLIDNARWDNDFAADGYVPSPYAGINNSVLLVDNVAPTTKTATAPKATSEKAAAPKTKPAAKKETTKVTTTKTAPAPKAASGKVTAPKTKPAAKKETAKAPTTKAAPTPKKETAKVATKEVKDDLKKIEGIGPKIAEILVNNGIATFSALSKTKPENIKKILETAGPKFNIHDPATWPTQADLAAKGKWDELKKLQDELNAGKKK